MEKRVTVPSGSGTIDIDFTVDPVIPVASDAYTLFVGLLPEGGSWADRLDEYTQENIDALAAPSDDATLSGILVNDTLISDFDAGITEYHFLLPSSTVNVPLVNAVRTDENATVVIIPADSLPGTTTIFVTAEDGQTTLNYTLNFTVAVANEITKLRGIEQLLVYPNPFTDRLWINTGTNESFIICNITGRIIYNSSSAHSQEINNLGTRTWQPGIYFLKTTSGRVIKLVKQGRR
ncbi:MAG: T9SS type A sorting domain-containing protein [Bacteroidales bacterium]|nr:T9SS type A sorting domain-containing protein [Bacteroidales bacterium]